MFTFLLSPAQISLAQLSCLPAMTKIISDEQGEWKNWGWGRVGSGGGKQGKDGGLFCRFGAYNCEEEEGQEKKAMSMRGWPSKEHKEGAWCFPKWRWKLRRKKPIAHWFTVLGPGVVGMRDENQLCIHAYACGLLPFVYIHIWVYEASKMAQW